MRCSTLGEVSSCQMIILIVVVAASGNIPSLSITRTTRRVFNTRCRQMTWIFVSRLALWHNISLKIHPILDIRFHCCIATLPVLQCTEHYLRSDIYLHLHRWRSNQMRQFSSWVLINYDNLESCLYGSNLEGTIRETLGSNNWQSCDQGKR